MRLFLIPSFNPQRYTWANFFFVIDAPITFLPVIYFSVASIVDSDWSDMADRASCSFHIQLFMAIFKGTLKYLHNQAKYMIMRLYELNQQIDEWSHTAEGIEKALIKKGYVFLGKGVDQSAYLEPSSGQVLKIFGTQHGSGRKFTRDQKMFFFWAEYCKKHKVNPNIPRFSDWSPFRFEGNTYIQIRMEKLTPLNHEIGLPLERLVNAVKSFSRVYSVGELKVTDIKQLKDQLEYAGYEIDKTLLKKLGEDKLVNFWNEFCNLAYMASSKGWHFDLHCDNFMKRKRTVVIVDPWVLARAVVI